MKNYAVHTVRIVLAAIAGLAMLPLTAGPASARRISTSPEIPAPTPRNEHFLREQGEGQVPPAASVPAAPEKGAHMDHKPKHGGSFFMSLDNVHHLEGVLLPPGTFRVYLYDDHTKPLKAEQTRLANGTVQMGDSDDAPKIDLSPGKKKETLEANLGAGVKFPVSLTLLLHLPGMAPDAKPELFNFNFTKFTDEHGPGTCRPMPSMPNMRC